MVKGSGPDETVDACLAGLKPQIKRHKTMAKSATTMFLQLSLTPVWVPDSGCRRGSSKLTEWHILQHPYNRLQLRWNLVRIVLDESQNKMSTFIFQPIQISTWVKLPGQDRG